jgi:hypothetical protein
VLPAPTHVNQFAAGGRFRDGKDSRRFDCAVSVGVMGVDAFTGGARRMSTTTFRALQDDHVGGIGLDDVADAWRAVGLRFDYGHKAWGAITARLAAGDPVCLTGWYATLGSHRAPGSSYLAGHMLYLQRLGRPGFIVVNDPLRSGPVELPVSALQRFWASSTGQAGWGVGAAPGVPPGDLIGFDPANPFGAILDGIGTIFRSTVLLIFLLGLVMLGLWLLVKGGASAVAGAVTGGGK